MEHIKAPFPWFGGKGRIAGDIVPVLKGSRLYVEPFAGSLAVFLRMPKAQHEIVNDYDCLVVNAWRAIAHHSNELADFLHDRPLMEVEYKAFARQSVVELRASVVEDMHYCDIESAGLWLQHQSSSIAGFNSGIDASSGKGVLEFNRRNEIRKTLNELSKRFRGTYIMCRDWSACLTPSILRLERREASVFLDPPYIGTEYVYSGEDCDSSGVASKVHSWCVENGADARLKICLAGHVGDYDLPGWHCIPWRRNRGIARKEATISERHEEALFFSPSCKISGESQGLLF